MLTRINTPGEILIALTVVILATILIFGAPVWAQTANDCREQLRAEAKRLSDVHLEQAKACHGDGECIRDANEAEAKGLKEASREAYDCRRAAAERPKSPELKALTPKMDTTRNQWKDLGGNTTTYTDEKGQVWSFRTRVKQGATTWVLQNTPPRINQMGSLREVYGSYREAGNKLPPKYVRGILQ